MSGRADVLEQHDLGIDRGVALDLGHRAVGLCLLADDGDGEAGLERDGCHEQGGRTLRRRQVVGPLREQTRDLVGELS